MKSAKDMPLSLAESAHGASEICEEPSAFAGMKRAALGAAPLGLVRVEGIEQRRQVANDILQLNLDAMKQRLAFCAIPLEAVDHACGALALDDQADASVRPLRRVPNMRWKKKDAAFADRKIARPPVLADAQHHVALDLIEEFLERIVVKIGAPIGPAHDRDDEIRPLPDLRVADGRAQEIAMRVDPLAKIERERVERHRASLAKPAILASRI